MNATVPQHVTQRQRPYKICPLWVHEENFSRQDVIFNATKFTDCGIELGSLAWIAAVDAKTAVRDFQTVVAAPKESEASGQRRGSTSGLSKSKQDFSRGDDELCIDENGANVEGGRQLDMGRYYVFLADDMSAEMKAKNPTLQISLSSHVANVFGFRRGMQVAVSAVSEPREMSGYQGILQELTTCVG